jgi:hypothetical protein
MENKELYKITTNSQETEEKLTINITLELLKIKNIYSNEEGLTTIAFHDCLGALHRNLLSVLEEVLYQCRKTPDNSGFTKHSYFSKILKTFSVDDLREIRAVMLNCHY